MKNKRNIFLALGLLAFLAAGSIQAQVTITNADIPTGHEVPLYYFNTLDSEPMDTLGIPVDLGYSGPDRTWDFSEWTSENVTVSTLFDPAQTGYAETFPNASRAIDGPDPLGITNSLRFEMIDTDSLALMGVVVALPPELEMGESIPIAFPHAFKILPLPLSFENEWTVTDTLEIPYTDQDTGAEVLIRIELGLFANVDSWGSVTLNGGEVDCIRTHYLFGATINAYPVIFGEPLPIPVFTQEIPATHTYVWMSPEHGDVVIISSLPGETEPYFDEASAVRVQSLEPVSSTLETIAELPTSAELIAAYPNPFNGQTNLTFTLNKPSDVVINAYDLLGRQRATIFQNALNAGTHATNWNADALPSGVYVLQLQTSTQRSAVRVHLVK